MPVGMAVFDPSFPDLRRRQIVTGEVETTFAKPYPRFAAYHNGQFALMISIGGSDVASLSQINGLLLGHLPAAPRSWS
jgi:hypothetical protein